MGGTCPTSLRPVQRTGGDPPNPQRPKPIITVCTLSRQLHHLHQGRQRNGRFIYKSQRPMVDDPISQFDTGLSYATGVPYHPQVRDTLWGTTGGAGCVHDLLKGAVSPPSPLTYGKEHLREDTGSSVPCSFCRSSTKPSRVDTEFTRPSHTRYAKISYACFV